MSRDPMFPSLDAMFRSENVEDVVRDCVTRANANIERMAAMRREGVSDVDIVRKVIEGADLVIAVFPDNTEPLGVGRHVIKGQRLLRIIGAEQQHRSGRLECLALTCREETAALQRTFG